MMVKETRLYDILEVQPDVDVATLKRKYRELARKYHPDRNLESADLFKDISWEKNCLRCQRWQGAEEAMLQSSSKSRQKVSVPNESSSCFQDRSEPGMTVSSEDENDIEDAEASGSQEFERQHLNIMKRKLDVGFESCDEQMRKFKKYEKEADYMEEGKSTTVSQMLSQPNPTTT